MKTKVRYALSLMTISAAMVLIAFVFMMPGSWLGDAFFFVNPVTGVAVSQPFVLQGLALNAQGTLNITENPQSFYAYASGDAENLALSVSNVPIIYIKGKLNGTVGVISTLDSPNPLTLPGTLIITVPNNVTIIEAWARIVNQEAPYIFSSPNKTVAGADIIDLLPLLNRSCNEQDCVNRINVAANTSFSPALPYRLELTEVRVVYTQEVKNLTSFVNSKCQSYPCSLAVQTHSTSGNYVIVNLTTRLEDVPLAFRPTCSGIPIGSCGDKPLMCALSASFVSNCTKCGCPGPLSCVGTSCVYVEPACPANGCPLPALNATMETPVRVYSGTVVTSLIKISGGNYSRTSFVGNVTTPNGTSIISIPRVNLTCNITCLAIVTFDPLNLTTPGQYLVKITNATTSLLLSFPIDSVNVSAMTFPPLLAEGVTLFQEYLVNANGIIPSHSAASYFNSAGNINITVGLYAQNGSLDALSQILPSLMDVGRAKGKAILVSDPVYEIFGVAARANDTMRSWVSNDILVFVLIRGNNTERDYSIPVCAAPGPGINYGCPSSVETIPSIDVLAGKYLPTMPVLRSVKYTVGHGISAISFPVIPLVNSTAWFAPYFGRVQQVLTYENGWRVYNPLSDAPSDIPAIEPGKGYLVNTNETVTFTFTGTPYNGTYKKRFVQGDNLVGVPRHEPCKANVTVISGNIREDTENAVPCTITNTYYSAAGVIDGIAAVVNGSTINLPLNATLESGAGYWFHTTNNANATI